MIPFLVAAALSSLAYVHDVRAAEPSAPLAPFEISEADRRAYAQSMKEARDLAARKEYDAAIAKLDELAAQRPREPQARFLKGVVLADQMKVDAAMDVYRGLTADFPELPEPHNNLAVLYAQKGELNLARDELLLAIRSSPDYAVAYENLGDVYAQLAAAQYERATSLDKRNKGLPGKLKLMRDATAPPPQ